MKSPEALATAVARVGTLGIAYKLDAPALLERFAPFQLELARYMRVTVPHAFDRLAVSTRVPSHDPRIAEVANAEVAAIAAELGGDKDIGLEVELARGGELAFAVHSLGARDLPNAPVDAIEKLGTLVGVTSRAFADTRALQYRVEVAGLDHLVASAEALGATQAQRNLIANLFPVLAKDGPTFATLRTSGDRLERELAVGWPQVIWETVVRLVQNFYPTIKAGDRLGELAGTFPEAETASLELVLGPSEPPGVLISVEARR